MAKIIALIHYIMIGYKMESEYAIISNGQRTPNTEEKYMKLFT